MYECKSLMIWLCYSMCYNVNKVFTSASIMLRCQEDALIFGLYKRDVLALPIHWNHIDEGGQALRVKEDFYDLSCGVKKNCIRQVIRNLPCHMRMNFSDVDTLL